MRAFLTIALSVVLTGCSEKRPSIIIAADDNGRPQLDYEGPIAKYSYNSGFESFTYNIGSLDGKTWISGSGEMKLGGSNDVTITIQSSSDRPYDIHVLGMSTNNSLDIGEDAIMEMFHIASGKQQLQIGRFIIHTYDDRKHEAN